MEALRNPPFGYEAWSRSNTPISVSPDNPDFIFGSSKHDRDAMFRIIGTLITENQTLKLENQQLKHKLKYDRQRKLEKAHQEPKCRKSHDTVQLSRSTKSALKACNYCRQVHRYGFSFCKAFGAVCSYCQQANHIEDACFFKYPHLRKFKKNRFRNRSRSEAKSATELSSKVHPSNSKDPTIEVHEKSRESCADSLNTEDEKNKSGKSSKRKKKKGNQCNSEMVKVKTTEDRENEDDSEAEYGIEISNHDLYEAWIKNMEDMPLELKVHKELLHCKEVLDLQYTKEYKEVKMKIKLLEETLEERKSNLVSKEKKVPRSIHSNSKRKEEECNMSDQEQLY